jgi:hypothetical protein
LTGLSEDFVGAMITPSFDAIEDARADIMGDMLGLPTIPILRFGLCFLNLSFPSFMKTT